MDQCHPVHDVERNASKWLHVVRAKNNKSSGNIQARLLVEKQPKTASGFEKPKLDNVRLLKGIYNIDLEDMEFKNIVKNARKKLEVQLNPPCRADRKVSEDQRAEMGSLAVRRSGRPVELSSQTNGNHDTQASVKPTNPPESALKRLNNTEITKALRRGSIRSVITILCRFFVYAPSVENSDAKAAVDKECENFRILPACRETKVKCKKNGHRAGTKRWKDRSSCNADGLMPLQVQRYTVRIVLRVML